MRTITLLLTLSVLPACSLVGNSTGAQVPSEMAPVGHVAPAAAGAIGAVALENLCEDPQDDTVTLSGTEAIADLFLMPVTAATYVARATLYMTVGVGMVYSGVDGHEAARRINGWFPWLLTGPDPDQVDYRFMNAPKGCIEAEPFQAGRSPPTRKGHPSAYKQSFPWGPSWIAATLQLGNRNRGRP